MLGRLAMDADVVVIGLGTAGSLVALQCARRGLKVLGIERGALDEAGARWVNGVPASAFTRAGISLPEGEELQGSGGRFHLICGYGPEKICVDKKGLIEVDMRLLTRRLQAEAQRYGAELLGEVRALPMSGEPQQPGGVVRGVETSRGVLRGRYYVDASGIGGRPLRAQSPLLGRDLCSAAQQVRWVADEAGAAAFLERYGASAGDSVCFTGVAGGYSIVNIRVEQGKVYLLTGSIPALGFPSGKELLARFVAENSWVGEALFGGARAIPLSLRAGSLVNGNWVGFGDAAGLVFAAHGSGIGLQLELSLSLAGALKMGEPMRYERAFNKKFRKKLWFSDRVRRLSQGIEGEQMKRLMGQDAWYASGAHWLRPAPLMDSESVRAGLVQEFPEFKLRKVPGLLKALIRERWLIEKLWASRSG